MSKEISQTLTFSEGADTELDDVDIDVENVQHPGKKPGSRADLRDMIRMGRRQEFSRNFNILSILGFTCLGISTWVATLNMNILDTVDGGMSNYVWTFLVVFICWLSVVASIAEMASMAPTAGGQYVWVSEFAPASIQRPLSYVTGWISVLAWQLAFAGNTNGLGSALEGWFALNGVEVNFTLWQSSFIQIGVAAIGVLFNTNIGNSLPLIGGSLAMLYFLAFLAILVPLWVLSPRTDPETVFQNFSAKGDPVSLGHSLVFGVFGPMYSLMAPDVAIHLAEEVKNSSLVLPRALMGGTLVNRILGFFMLVTVCFTSGDLKALSSSKLGVTNQVLLNATGSTATVYGLSIMTQILSLACAFALATAASRQLFAFARDRGIPFSSFLSHVRPGWNVPLNALLVSFGTVTFVSLMNIGASRFINNIVSISVSGVIASYIVSIGCVRLKRLRNEPLPSRRWSLGRWGGLINDIALLFLTFCFIVFFIPYLYPVTAGNMNYNIVVFVGTATLALVYYYIKGKHEYISPRSLIRKDT